MSARLPPMLRQSANIVLEVCRRIPLELDVCQLHALPADKRDHLPNFYGLHRKLLSKPSKLQVSKVHWVRLYAKLEVRYNLGNLQLLSGKDVGMLQASIWYHKVSSLQGYLLHAQLDLCRFKAYVRLRQFGYSVCS